MWIKELFLGKRNIPENILVEKINEIKKDIGRKKESGRYSQNELKQMLKIQVDNCYKVYQKESDNYLGELKTELSKMKVFYEKLENERIGKVNLSLLQLKYEGYTNADLKTLTNKVISQEQFIPVEEHFILGKVLNSRKLDREHESLSSFQKSSKFENLYERLPQYEYIKQQVEAYSKIKDGNYIQTGEKQNGHGIGFVALPFEQLESELLESVENHINGNSPEAEKVILNGLQQG